MDGRTQINEELALASDVFDQFCGASTQKAILGHYRHLCDLLHIKPTNFSNFYPKLKSKLRSWKAQALWAKFDKRASHKCYNRGKACPNTRVLIIGAGPCGLRTAIEAQLLGAKVVIVEKRDRLSRNNVLHLWPFVIADLRALGAKKFFGKFCAGAIDHISIRQLQCILMKVALLLGVEIHEGLGFEGLVSPPEDQTSGKIGWRAQISPTDHPVAQYEFDVLIGADGKRNTLEGFKRKEFRGKLAIAITANFINRHTEAEARVEEISGVAFIFNQKFFKDLHAETGIDLENIVYYKDETHYFVMTAKKHSLINKGVIIQDYSDTAKLLAPENVDKDALQRYAREAADFSTNYQLPDPEFAVNHYGQPDVAMFDFTSMFAAENASRVVERYGHKLLQILVGDSLLEPFWPTGSGCARGFLSSLDACWVVKSWGSGQASVLEVLAERESIYRLLAQTTPENLQRDTAAYTLDPFTRYTNLNIRCVTPVQVRCNFDTDNPDSLTQLTTTVVLEMPKKRRRKVKDTQVHPDTLLHWLKKQVALYEGVHVENMEGSFRNGMVMCAVIHRYRPDLIDFHALNPENVATNNQLAFDILERELGISPVMTGQEMAECKVPDKLTMLSYLSQIYDTFRGEIPHIKHPRLEPEHTPATPHKVLRQSSKEQAVNILSRITSHSRPSVGRKRTSMDKEPDPAAGTPRTETLRRQRKRRSMDRDRLTANERQWIVDEIERNRMERMMRRKYLRHLATQQFYKSMQMLQMNDKPEPTPYEDYSLFVYRQTAPAFEDRVKDMEKKILYPDREARLRAEIAEIRKGGIDEDLSGRIKVLEEKLKGTPVTEKKPRDLYRAIGKIEKSDWNVKEIEKKIQENKMGRTTKHERSEKVPKWSREQFDDKFQAVKMKLQTKSSDFSPNDKHAEVDVTLKRIDKKLKDGSALDVGPKVSAMAEQFAVKSQEPEKPSLQRSNSKAAMFVPAQGSSETCHFCNKRVYLMERMSTEGKFFHRGCFRCEYCNTALRLGNYAFDRDGSYGSRFFCMQHFGMKGMQCNRMRRKSEELKSGVDKENIPAKVSPKTPAKAKSLCDDVPDKSSDLANVDLMTTPERIEFENLSGAALDVEEAPSEMDEDEWTDRNFGASAAEGSSDSSDLSDSEDEEEEEANEVFEEAIDQPVPVTVDATRQLAETWSRRYSKNNVEEAEGKASEVKIGKEEKKDDDDDSDSFEFEDSDGDNSYHEYDSGDDESETATEGEDDEAARELRRQEVRLEVPQLPRGWKDTDSGSDTEIVSESTSTESESDEVENSATEIETDSEFEHDGTTPTHEIPAILIDDSNITRRIHQEVEPPKKVQVRSGHILRPINGTVVTKPLGSQQKENQDGVKLKFTPLRPEQDNKSSSLSNLTVGNNIINMSNKAPIRTPLINPRPGDYLLNRTHSTEGIASKLSLELKKKYLLGASGLPGSVKKSGSATTLDSKVKNFVDMISEHQKLLHPAPEPSPTMQAFLQGTSKLSIANKPLSPPSPTLLDPSFKLLPPSTQQISLSAKKEKALPSDGDVFEHVCKLGWKQEIQSDFNEKQSHEINGSAVLNGEKVMLEETVDSEQLCSGKDVPKNTETIFDSHDTNKFVKKEHEEEADCRPRSPVHETSIIVPDIPWKISRTEVNGDEDIESDSLSSSDSLSNLDDESDDHKSGSLQIGERTPPRVEIHDSSGTLMMEGISEQEKYAKEVILEFSDRPGQFVSELSSPVDSAKTTDVISRERKQSTVTSDRSSPSTPPSLRGEDSESIHNEATLAETELSDWAQDGDAIVSEDLEDVEFNIDPHFITTRRHRNLRKGGKVLGARIARAEEEFEDFDDPGHICSMYKDVATSNATSQLLSNTDSIEYMDTGPEEDSSTDDVFAATNESLLKNKGYIQFVNSFDEEDISTPLVEAQNAPAVATAVPAVVVTESGKDGEDTSESPDTIELSNIDTLVVVSAGEMEGNTTEETTTSGEVVTVKDSPLDHENFYTPDSQSSRDIENASNQEYEEYVRRLQGRISPFSNVRDSIDIRKSRRKNKPPAQLQDLIAEELGEELSRQNVTTSENDDQVSPSSTSQKLVEISRERSKQKDLIHEMVLNKVLTQKKSPYEKKPKRCRSVSSPLASPGPTTPVKSFFEMVPTLPTVEGKEDALKSRIQLGDEIETDRLNVLKDLEVPSLSDSLIDEDVEKFYTPVTSFKTKMPPSQSRQRPLSVHASFPSSQHGDDSPSKTSILPDTPLTNPEAFSLPDIRRALFKSSETTELPVPPPRTRHDESKKSAERDRLYEEARKRARLKSDEELGLSPEDYVIALREKVKSSASSKRIERCLSEPGESVRQDQNKASEETVTKSFPVEAMPRKSKSSSKLNDSPQVVATSSQLTSNATFYVGQDAVVDSQGKKKKDRDRRKSIIQAVSDFFHKKRDSPNSSSPPKTPLTAKEKFSKFKFTKGKDKGKSPYSSWSEDSDNDKPLPRRMEEASQPVRSRSSDTPFSSKPSNLDPVPPPIPPPPANYEGSAVTPPRMSEDSLSDPEEDSRATTLSASTHDGGTGTTSRRQSRLNRRMARQAHLKRLRMAQEIQRQLEEVEVKQRQLEQRGVSVEKALRGEGTDVEVSSEEGELLREWFDLMRERSELRRFERELMVRAEEIELEDRHARLQQELRDRMSVDDCNKTSVDIAKEGQILKEMLEIVERRDSLILLLEEDRKRYKEEDRDLEAQMLAKGVRLTPLRKESHV